MLDQTKKVFITDSLYLLFGFSKPKGSIKFLGGRHAWKERSYPNVTCVPPATYLDHGNKAPAAGIGISLKGPMLEGGEG